MMRRRQRLGLALLACVGALSGRGDDAVFDRIEQALTFGAGAGWSARVGGMLDLEAYRFQAPAPSLIDADGTGLFAPRLALFLDAQAGDALYAFAQMRVDRGFDPADKRFRGRLDEYAVRLTPWRDGRLSVQAGQFATVVGNWVPRHASWDNAFVTAPLPYENPTGLWDSMAVPSTDVLLAWAHIRPAARPGMGVDDKYLRLPVIWGPGYASGAAVSGRLGRWDYAVEVKNASLSSRPEEWSVSKRSWRWPAAGVRIGFHPDERWSLGLSAADGAYLRAGAAGSVAPDFSLRDYRERVFGADLSYARHHLELWVEVLVARFAVPTVATVETRTGYLEAKYKVSPRWFAAVRLNRQEFSSVTAGDGARLPWGSDVWRLDLAPGCRLTPHVQVKLQGSLQRDDRGPRTWSALAATQLTVRF